MAYTSREKHDEALRELRMRERVFSRLVNVGSKTKEQALHQINLMTEIAEDYRQLMKQEQLFDADLVPPTRAKAHRSHNRTVSSSRQDHAGEPRQETAPANSVGPSPAQADQGRTGGGDTGPTSDVPLNPSRADG